MNRRHAPHFHSAVCPPAATPPTGPAGRGSAPAQVTFPVDAGDGVRRGVASLTPLWL